MHIKYTGMQITLHWLVFILVILAWLSMDFRHDFPDALRPLVFTVHASCGISVGILMLARIALRFRYPAPAIEPRPPVWATGLAHLGHLLIWLLFLALPLSGGLMLYFKAGVWHAFGIAMPVASVPDLALKSSFKSWHQWMALASYWIIGLHAAAALLHHYLWRDNTLYRMMPGRR